MWIFTAAIIYFSVWDVVAALCCVQWDAWWLISTLNPVHLASLPAQLCPLLQLWVTNLHPEAVSKSHHSRVVVVVGGGGGADTQTSRHTYIFITLSVYSSQHHTCIFVTSASFSSLTHTSLLPQESDLFMERLRAGVGGGMAVLFHPAQTGSQINNILSPAGQLVQARQTASENLSLWFQVCRLS